MKIKEYKSVKEFGKALGLSEIDMAVVQQKKKIIEKLKKQRLKLKISQAALAKIVGSKQPAIARMESGQVSEVSLDFLARIALALDTSFTFYNTKLAA
jgi:DNA-binding Xre family transcriptional regulator